MCLLSVKVFLNLRPVLALPAYLVYRQIQSLICCMQACVCPFSFFHAAAQCLVCPGCCCMCSSCPSPLLPSPNRSGLQLVCFALLLEFRLQGQNRPWLLVSGDEGGGGRLMPPGQQRMIRTDPIQAQLEFRLNVLLLYLQQPPPAAHHTCYTLHKPIFALRLASFFHSFVCHLRPELCFV